jgi:hypothetical protein
LVGKRFCVNPTKINYMECDPYFVVVILFVFDAQSTHQENGSQSPHEQEVQNASVLSLA